MRKGGWLKMVLNFEETKEIEDLKQKNKITLIDKVHANTMLELHAQLKIEAMKSLSEGKLLANDEVNVRTLVFPENEEE